MPGKGIAALVLCLSAIVVAGVPIQTMSENWDSYAEGTADAAYNEKWASIVGASRYPVEAAASGVPSSNSIPNALKIGKLETFGITRSLLPEIAAALPDGAMVIGADAEVLRVSFIVDFNSLNSTKEDIFVELSLGETHVDGTSGTTKSVIAFGMTYKWFGDSEHPRIFNGRDWVLAEGVNTDVRFNHFTLEMARDTLTLAGSRRASGSHTVDRVYLGGFDRISIRTIEQNDQKHLLDDVEVSGGVVVAELPEIVPSLEFVEPAEGPPEGGTQVTVRGTGFLEGAEITFGGAKAGAVALVSARALTCVTPPHDPGVVDVEVVNPGGETGSLDGGFRYAQTAEAFRRGDSNQDGSMNIADAVYVLQNLFAQGPAIACKDAADSNDDEGVNIADAVYVLQNLFAQGPPIPSPGPTMCGPDTTGHPQGGPLLPACVYAPTVPCK